MTISIHAPHTGRDCLVSSRPCSRSYFNPRAPYGARRTRARSPCRCPWHFNPRAPYGARRETSSAARKQTTEFQSTRPIRGATPNYQTDDSEEQHFNPRAPYGARRGRGVFCCDAGGISIHAPHTGRDKNDRQGYGNSGISIHAPHTGRDASTGSTSSLTPYFNPRAPYGARPKLGYLFLS